MKMMLLSYFGLHGVTSSLPILVLGCDSYMYNMMINSGYMVGFFWGQVWKMNDLFCINLYIKFLIIRNGLGQAS